jgi:serpin B
MKKLIFVMLTLICLITTSLAQKKSSIESINAFSFKILEQINNKTGNCFFSPYSVYGALSMTYAGAKESTKLELEKVLELSRENNIPQDFFELTNAIGFEREFTFLSSNSLWLQKSLKPEKEYLKLVQEKFNAKIDNVNFAEEKDREKARLQINQWIENQTKGKLMEFLPKGMLDESTTMILINAVYFNALWNTQFPSDSIKSQAFYISRNDSVNCMMMNVSLETRYYEDDAFQVMEIPYQNGKASMMVFLPRQEIKSNTEKFDYEYLKKISQSMNSRDVNLALPKFKLETTYELSDCLKKMGLKSAFEPGADFSGISGNKSLMLDKIIHKSILDVSEKGTEAASSTAVISMRSTKIVREPVHFNANHPFYFLIKESSDNLILFMGYLASPGTSANN